MNTDANIQTVISFWLYGINLNQMVGYTFEECFSHVLNHLKWEYLLLFHIYEVGRSTFNLSQHLLAACIKDVRIGTCSFCLFALTLTSKSNPSLELDLDFFLQKDCLTRKGVTTYKEPVGFYGTLINTQTNEYVLHSCIYFIMWKTSHS